MVVSERQHSVSKARHKIQKINKLFRLPSSGAKTKRTDSKSLRDLSMSMNIKASPSFRYCGRRTLASTLTLTMHGCTTARLPDCFCLHACQIPAERGCFTTYSAYACTARSRQYFMALQCIVRVMSCTCTDTRMYSPKHSSSIHVYWYTCTDTCTGIRRLSTPIQYRYLLESVHVY